MWRVFFCGCGRGPGKGAPVKKICRKRLDAARKCGYFAAPPCDHGVPGRQGRADRVRPAVSRGRMPEGFDKCRRCQMPNTVAPFQPVKDPPRRVSALCVTVGAWAVRSGVCPPYLVTLRDHLFCRKWRQKAWPTHGSIVRRCRWRCRVRCALHPSPEIDNARCLKRSHACPALRQQVRVFLTGCPWRPNLRGTVVAPTGGGFPKRSRQQ